MRYESLSKSRVHLSSYDCALLRAVWLLAHEFENPGLLLGDMVPMQNPLVSPKKV